MKQKEIEKLSAEDLIDKLAEFKKKLADLKMTHTVSPIENPLLIRETRRVISRIYTAMSYKNKSK
ncbi:MAG: 50S ribosomal protein L29 [Candidatus Marivariicella sp.]|jgi:large subunit ribosomal protein L29|tara:strand:+ start:1449 stop:1643 length:195 start_codon:yes stop_codon:yes gene_type:complete